MVEEAACGAASQRVGSCLIGGREGESCALFREVTKNTAVPLTISRSHLNASEVSRRALVYALSHSPPFIFLVTRT